MKKKKYNKLGDVERFLSAFVAYAVDQGVLLITHAMTNCEGRHCLLGELLARGGRYDGEDELNDELARRLGIPANMVVDIMEGWDWAGWPGTTLPFERLGRRLRTRYLLRNKRVTEANA